MKLPQLKYLILYVTIVILALSYFLFFREKTGFIDNNRLFNGFAGATELQENAKKNMASRFNTLDSLNKAISDIELANKNRTPHPDTILLYNRLVINRDSAYTLYQDLIEGINSKISTQVWNTLNEYVIQYGKEKHYDYIYGATGNGNIMYGSDSKDITEKVIKYANDKYNNK